MFNSVRAEFRKLYSVRSTYVLTAVILALAVVLIGFWIYGYKNAGHTELNVDVIREMLYNAAAPAGLFAGIIAILAFGHEYRYNTILYGLTNVNHRTKLFFGKLVALLIFGVVLCSVVMGLGIAAFYLGQNLNHVTALKQTMPDAAFIGRLFATMLGFISFGFVIAALLRSLVGAIVVFLMLPTLAEQLLTLLLKDNIKYLPFTALGNVASTSPGGLNATQSLWVVIGYVVGAGLLAYILFLRRDAN